MEQKEEVKQAKPEKSFCEVISSEITDWGIIYRIRSNRTDIHLGDCEVKQ